MEDNLYSASMNQKLFYLFMQVHIVYMGNKATDDVPRTSVHLSMLETVLGRLFTPTIKNTMIEMKQMCSFHNIIDAC